MQKRLRLNQYFRRANADKYRARMLKKNQELEYAEFNVDTWGFEVHCWVCERQFELPDPEFFVSDDQNCYYGNCGPSCVP